MSKTPRHKWKKEKSVQNVFPLYRNDGDDDNTNSINHNIYLSTINIAEDEALCDIICV